MHLCDTKGNATALAWMLFLALQLLTFNRGMAKTYTFTGFGNWDDPSNWDTYEVPPSTLASGNTIILIPADYCNLTTDLVIEQGATLVFNVYGYFNVYDFDITIGGTFDMGGNINSDTDFNLTINATGVLNLEGSIFVHGVFINEGSIYGNGGSLILESGENNGFLQLNNFTQLSVDAGYIFSNNGTLETNGSGSVNNSGSFFNGGIMEINGQFWNRDFFNPGTLTNNGIIKGTGTIRNEGTFSNSGAGSIEPGLSPGTLTINGNINFGDGSFNVEINGTNQGTDYDLLAVSGTATIASNSLLNIIFGYNPTIGTTYDILTASSVEGAFIEPDYVSFGGGNVGAIELSYPDDNTLRVTVSGLLPVELVNFDARPQAGQVQLHWKTASEQDNKGFDVQRSADARHWQTLGFVAGNGTSFTANEYVFMDKLPLQGMNYYRLRQVDFNEVAEFSPIKTVKMDKDGGSIHIFPNPAQYEATLTLDTDYSGEATIIIYDATGKQISNYPIFIHKAETLPKLELSGIPVGIYWLELRAGKQRWNDRLIVK